MYLDELKLIKKTTSKDSIGNIINTETESTVLCQKNNVGTKEFYAATAVGITPTAELQIRKSNYDGETEVEFKGTRYTVIRTIEKKFDMVLVIGVKEGTM